MKVLALYLLCAGLYAAQSIELIPANNFQATGSIPNTSTFSTIGDFRFEFRMHNLTQPVDYNGFFFAAGGGSGTQQFFCRFYQAAWILSCTDQPDTAINNYVNISLTNPTDKLVRFQRSHTNNLITLETWDTATGQNYQVATQALTSSSNLDWRTQFIAVGYASTNIYLAYWRAYNSVLALNSPPPSYTNGNLWDFEFEGNLNDISGNSVTVTVTSGSAVYSTTPTFPISILFGQYGQQRVWSANRGALTLNASGTYSSYDNPVYTYSWSMASGPGIGNFSSPTSVTTLFTVSAAGDYLITLNAGDGHSSGSLSVDMGSVNTTAQGIVQTGNSAMDVSIGPLTMWGTSPVPWYDFAEMGNADALYGTVTTAPQQGATSLPGSITCTQGSTACTGSAGTHFTTDLFDCLPSGGVSNYTCTSSTMTGASYSAMFTPAPLSGGYQPYPNYFFKPDVTCASSCTLNVNGIGAVSLSAGVTSGTSYLLGYSGGVITITAQLPLIYVWFTAPDGAGTGRAWENISAITDDHDLVLTSNYLPPTSTGVPYSKPSQTELGINWNYVGQPSNNINYYDVVHALYKLYYRTGLTKYQTAARTLADNWYQYATVAGYYDGAPRAMGWLGMMDRAVDGHATIWQAFDQYITYSNISVVFYSTPQPVGTPFDARETAFITRGTLRDAANNPSSSQRTAYCSKLHNVVVNLLASALDSIGQWEEDDYNENISIPLAPLPSSGAFGSAPWRASNAGLALEEAYSVLSAPTLCNDSAGATAALSTVESFATFVHNYGEGAGYGQFANVMYGTPECGSFLRSPFGSPCGGNPPPPTPIGTINITSGSTAVTGSGTNFTSIFTPGVTWIGVPELHQISVGCNLMVQVASVTNDTSLTLTANWPCASSTSGVSDWLAQGSATYNCAPYGGWTPGQVCDVSNGGPDIALTDDVHAMWAWLYNQTGSAYYLDWALQTFGTSYGGSSGGPGSTLPTYGPYATGKYGNFDTALWNCTLGLGLPCDPIGQGIGPASLGKNYAFSAGAGNANNALAYLAQAGYAYVPASTVISGGKVSISGKVNIQ